MIRGEKTSLKNVGSSQICQKTVSVTRLDPKKQNIRYVLNVDFSILLLLMDFCTHSLDAKLVFLGKIFLNTYRYIH